MGAGNQVVWLDNVGHPFSHRLAAAKAGESHYHDHSLTLRQLGPQRPFLPD